MDIVRSGVPLSQARVACIFVHGRGQSPEAMEEGIVRHMSTPKVAYILPRAQGGSWYAARAVDALTAQSKSELAASLDVLGQVVSMVRAEAPDLPLLLGGFSQGACLSLEYAFANGPWRGALVALTGCRVGQIADVREASNLASLPVYLTGGDADPWIPLSGFAEAAVALGAAQARLRADVFPGRGHEASPTEISVLDAMLADLAAGRAASFERHPHA